MEKNRFFSRVRLRLPLALFFIFSTLFSVHSQSSENDASVMLEFRKNISPVNFNGDNPCTDWVGIQCSRDNRVTRIQIRNQNLTGSLPFNLGNLTALKVLDLAGNKLTGALPSLSGMSSVQSILLTHNNFTSIPSDFFTGMSSLQDISLDYNPFNSWSIPESLRDASALKSFSVMNANISGEIPDFFGGDTFAGLTSLHLSYNFLEGELPKSFSGSYIQSLWLNGQNGNSKLSGGIDVLKNMTQLIQVWLHSNSFSGPIPDLSGLTQLEDFSIRDNSFTGPVPATLMNLHSLKIVNLTNNLLQGPIPSFDKSVAVDNTGINSFCSTNPGVNCDSRISQLLDVAESMGYPKLLAENWKGNDPCSSNSWLGITCFNNNISVINLQKLGLNGTISPKFAEIKSIQRLILANNNLTGTIPIELTSLDNLKELDLSNNRIYGKIPPFKSSVAVKTNGNVNIGKDTIPMTPGSPSSTNTPSESPENGKKSSAKVVAGSVVGGLCAFFVAGILVFFLYRTKRKRSSRVQSPNTVVHPRHSGSDNDAVKITVAGCSSATGAPMSETYSYGSNSTHDIHVVESGGNGNMVISIQVLKNVTNNFSEKNVLGRGGFGTVYKGELHDGTKIAVKRMESSVVTDKGLNEFKSEIAVLTKVRHRHLVALLGYCLDGNERLLVFEYMPQGTLSRHLFNWSEEGLKPLEWSKRLIIALDVARGVEYLHSLAQQTFIHRDLKPSNILLGDDMHAKVADFGLVRLAPEGKASIVTRLAGTFGYLAPEYAAMGRVTTKIDVFSFGVILMELITGKKALDDTQNDDSMQLVPWFRRMYNSKDTFRNAIDPMMNLDEESLASVMSVAELAFHCTAREPHQRPDMGHAVNVLSSQAELWKPSESDPDDIYGIDYDMSLPDAIKKWQAMEGMSGYDGTSSSMLGSNDNTQTSIPTRPSGFANSFTSADGR